MRCDKWNRTTAQGESHHGNYRHVILGLNAETIIIQVFHEIVIVRMVNSPGLITFGQSLEYDMTQILVQQIIMS